MTYSYVSAAQALAAAVFLLVPMAAAQSHPSIKTGPEVGKKLPNVTLATHNGVRRSLKQLAGPNGLYLVVHRSADW